MFRIVVILMIGIPALEIWGLIKAASFIGGWETFFLVLLTGVVGAYLAKLEGLKTLMRAQYDMQQGKVPGKAILDGISIFTGGLLLLTPGFFTDMIGLLLILPYTRDFFQVYLKKWLYNKIKNGQFNIYYNRRF